MTNLTYVCPYAMLCQGKLLENIIEMSVGACKAQFTYMKQIIIIIQRVSEFTAVESTQNPKTWDGILNKS